MRRANLLRITKDYVDRILRSKVYDVAIESPLERAALQGLTALLERLDGADIRVRPDQEGRLAACIAH